MVLPLCHPFAKQHTVSSTFINAAWLVLQAKTPVFGKLHDLKGPNTVQFAIHSWQMAVISSMVSTCVIGAPCAASEMAAGCVLHGNYDATPVA